MKEDLTSPFLFGNEAGEDEDIKLLNRCFVEKPEYEVFYKNCYPFQIVRSNKGYGKSALLKRTLSLAVDGGASIALYLKGSDLMLNCELTELSPHRCIHRWKQCVCGRIVLEIGKRINVAHDEISKTLVRFAQKEGYRSRSRNPELLESGPATNPLSFENGHQAEYQEDRLELLKRYTNANEVKIWLCIDDIDGTYLNSPEQQLIISTFFSACRDIAHEVRGPLYPDISQDRCLVHPQAIR